MAIQDATRTPSGGSQNRSSASEPGTPSAFYKAHLAESITLLSTLQQQIRNIALLRLVTGVAIFLTIYRLFRTFGSPLWWMILMLLFTLFIFLLRRSGALQEAEAYQKHRKQINELELEGLEGRFERFEGDKTMVSNEHPFAFDLDLFGDRSLFQRINRTVTLEGKKTLGSFLAYPEQDGTIIRGRQAMVGALQKTPEWCQQFQITGSLNEEEYEDKKNIEDWLRIPPALYPDKSWKIILTALPLITIGCWLLYIFGPFPAYPAITLSLIQLGIAGNRIKMINNSHILISKRAGTLKKYHSLIQLFGGYQFEETGLNALQNTIKVQEESAGAFLKLHKLIHALDNRLNIIVGVILNGLLLWDLNCLYRIEYWKQQFKDQFPEWIRISSILDALISIAVYNYNHPDYITPVIRERLTSQDFNLDIQEGLHPLLYPDNSVPNDLHQPSSLNLFLITGANMAGKSTFLRMVGLNMILAMAGSNVAASHMSLTPVALYTSMRTNDSLFTHTSFFYAELKKLQWIMEQIRSQKPVYIMLDEILKGTNSRDQHLGSAALIHNIIQLKGRGLIATHDIELTTLADIYPENLKNIAFEIDIKEDKMIFSYQYRDGVCQNMNASVLMKQMGIT